MVRSYLPEDLGAMLLLDHSLRQPLPKSPQVSRDEAHCRSQDPQEGSWLLQVLHSN